MPVVDDLVPDVDRRTILGERTLNDVDRANDACAESARLRENDLHALTRLLSIAPRGPRIASAYTIRPITDSIMNPSMPLVEKQA